MDDDAAPSPLKSQTNRFLAVGAFAYEKVVLWRNPKGSLDVYVYTDAQSPGDATEEEFLSKIGRADSVLSQASAENAEFAATIQAMTRVYEFCFDYGNGSFSIASAKGGKIEWSALYAK